MTVNVNAPGIPQWGAGVSNVWWITLLPIPFSLYDTCLQGIMVAVLIILDICFDEYNYHDSVQVRLLERFGH